MNGNSSTDAIVKWIDERLPIFTYIDQQLNQYPAPRNLNYWWNFGSLAGFMLIVMIITGIILAMNYTPHVDMAFSSVEGRIMRDVNYGWLMRYVHMNGASMFFVVVYIHVFRGLYYGSYKAPRELLWWLGIIILLLMMATAFMGYLLPWGQMSFWGATVITNLFSAIPLVGDVIVEWLRGGFAVSNPTLNRFFSFHYLMPFVILAVVGLHVMALRTTKSNNPLGIDAKGPQDTIPFHPYYTIKDMYGLGVFLIVYAAFVFFAPDFFGEPDNYIPANPLQTPEHIVPEWYFLPFYAILRAVPDNFIGGWIGFILIDAKLAGVITMFASIIVLFALPWLDTSPVRSARFRPIYKYFFWFFLIDTVILGVVGAHAPNEPVFEWNEGFTYLVLGKITTTYYFFHFLVLLPLLGRMERPRPLPQSISEPVLKGGGATAASAASKPLESA